MSYRHTHYKKDRLGLTANYQATFGMHDIEAGLWYEQSDREESRDWHKVIDARIYHHFDSTPYWTQYKNTFETDTLKWYAQDSMALGDFTLNLGVKKYLVDIEKYDHYQNATTAKINSDSDILFSGGILYQLNDSTELFTSYSENFAAIKDGVLERDSSDLSAIEPETAENIDLGVRYQNNALKLTATAYSIEFDNRITFIAPGSDTGGIDYTIGTNGSYLNVGGIESKGLELSASYMLNSEWNIYSSYTNNDSEYKGDAPGFEAGDKVIDSVDDLFVLSTDYYSGDFRFGLSAKYTGERGEVDGYTVLDLNAGYSAEVNAGPFKALDIAFVVYNVTDKSYLAGGTGNGTTYFIGAPRTAAVTLSATF